MRRIWVAVVLVLIIASLSVYNILNLNNVSRDTQMYLKKMKQQFNKENYTAAEFTANELENSWKNNTKILDRFISQDHLEQVGSIVAELPYLAKSKSHEFIVHIELLKTHLQHIIDKEKLRLY